MRIIFINLIEKFQQINQEEINDQVSMVPHTISNKFLHFDIRSNANDALEHKHEIFLFEAEREHQNLTQFSVVS